MIKQLSSTDQTITNDFVDNSERVLKDTVKVLQTCLATIAKNENTQQQQQEKKTIPIEQPKPTIETKKSDNEIQPEKDPIIENLNTKYQEVTLTLNETQQKYQEELT